MSNKMSPRYGKFNIEQDSLQKKRFETLNIRPRDRITAEQVKWEFLKIKQEIGEPYFYVDRKNINHQIATLLIEKTHNKILEELEYIEYEYKTVTKFYTNQIEKTLWKEKWALFDKKRGEFYTYRDKRQKVILEQLRIKRELEEIEREMKVPEYENEKYFTFE